MILIDTGPLVALCDARDSRHHLAVRRLATLAKQPLATCDAVVAEACFHLPHRVQRERLGAFLRDLQIEPAPALQDSRFRAEVFAWLLKYADHEPDWADACLAVLAGHDRDARVWTYDVEFRAIWRRPDGSAVPLAVKV